MLFAFLLAACQTTQRADYAADCLAEAKRTQINRPEPQTPDRFKEYWCLMGTKPTGLIADARAGDDVVSGGPHDDVIVGGLDNDRLDGGEGVDLAGFAGKRADYVILRNGNKVVVSGPDGIDMLSNIEVVSFDDAPLNLAAALDRVKNDGVLSDIPVWGPDVTDLGCNGRGAGFSKRFRQPPGLMRGTRWNENTIPHSWTSGPLIPEPLVQRWQNIELWRKLAT